jgi:hypothetical protein
LFKIVTDLENGKEIVVDQRFSKRIISIYIYNNLKENGIKRAIEIKEKSKKVRGFYMDISVMLNQAKMEIEN